MRVKSIKIEEIVANSKQPRKHFDEEKIAELAISIKQYGVLQPIIVKEVNEGYEIIAGERRFRAAKLAKLTSVPVVISDVDRYLSNKIAIIENVQREDLTVIEEALAYKQLIEDYELTQLDVARVIGKKPSTISNKLRILKLESEVQDAIRERKLSERHGRALLHLNRDEQLKYLDDIIKYDYTVKQLENKLDKKKPKAVSKGYVSKNYKLAVNTIKQAVDLIDKSGFNTQYNEAVEDDELVITLRISKED